MAKRKVNLGGREFEGEEIGFLPDNENGDWAVTVTFYAAVQYIEAYFAKSTPAIHSLSHHKRDCDVGRSLLLKPQWRNYRELKNQSGLARYEAHVSFAQTDVDKAKKRLDAIKAVVLPKL